MPDQKKPLALQSAEEWNHKGRAFLQSGDVENAIAAYRQSIESHGEIPEAHANLSIALHALRRFPEALDSVMEALRLRPRYPQAYNTLASIYQNCGEASKAIAAYQQAIVLKPDYLHPLINLGKLLQQLGNSAGAIAVYEKALALDSDNADLLSELLYQLQTLCRWEKTQALQATLLTLLEAGESANPFIVALFASSSLQLTNTKKWAAKNYPRSKDYDAKRILPADARHDKKLRIGYISSDFHHHATAFLISELFEQHARDKFEIFAYSCGPDNQNAERLRIQSSCDRFTDMRSMDDQSAAALVEQDGLDILVDLKGYTQDARLGILSRRPAPLQMHYLGYPGTTGANFIDYFIADSVTAPAGLDAAFSEKLIRLPHSYQINDRRRPAPASRENRAAHGLPEDAFVFCGFNRMYKITSGILDIWMRLLQAVKKSVLWLWETSEEVAATIKAEAQKRGIDASRIIIAPLVPQSKHLERYAHADLFLDTYPVCGHTTASDALWCGIPLVTIAGESFISRVAASLLAAVGLPELITTDEHSYEALALSLAQNPARLAGLRKHLSDGRMRFPLFDSVAVTRAIEAAYMHAAELHRAGKMPAAFRLTPELSISE